MIGSQQTSIHFGYLGNGINVYDVSKYNKTIDDYPTIAHISNEGNVTLYSHTLSENDMNLIISKGKKVRKSYRTEVWNKLTVEEKYQKILDAVNDEIMMDIINETISVQQKVEKYENRVIFKGINHVSLE